MDKYGTDATDRTDASMGQRRLHTSLRLIHPPVPYLSHLLDPWRHQGTIGSVQDLR